MKKPQEIIEIENSYGIELREAPKGEDVFRYRDEYNDFRNHYQLDDENNVTGLNLSENKISKITNLDNLTRLSVLDLSSNQISEINNLDNLTRLSVLDLSSNQISEINNLDNLTRLSVLNLSSNQISEINNLGNLTQLSELGLSNNQISEIKNLDNLTQLSELDLSGNHISEIKNLDNLTQLSILYLHDNHISEIKNLDNLTQLFVLYLKSNHISEIKNLDNLTQLSTLVLPANQISEIKNLDNLTQLSELYLSQNEISEIKNLDNLTRLFRLDISGNQISDISPILKKHSLKEVLLHWNSQIEIDYPQEVLKADWEAIKQFSEEAKEKIFFRNVKVLLLGNPNIGKSNLLEYLETKEKPILENSTHGVHYKKVKLEETDFHIWDFGGQEYFHATHQLFFSNNAINIVLWGEDIQRANRIEKCFHVDYWLRIIQQLNGKREEKVLLTENKIDLNNPPYSEKHITSIYTNAFPELRFYESHISLLHLINVNGFTEKLIQLSDEIVSKFKYPKFYEVFWRRIKNLNKDYASIEDINKPPFTDNAVSAMKVFHNRGMVLYFDKILPDKVFVKPQVLLELLYESVLKDHNKYKISEEDIRKSIHGNTLDISESDIIKLLKHFNLVFEITEEKGYYFIPQYLPEQKPVQKQYEELGFSLCTVKIKADHYLVSLAMLKLFAVYGKYVDKDRGDYLFWKNGIVIRKNNQQVLVKYDVEKQVIQLYASKDQNYRELQKELVDFILDLPEDLDLPKRNFQNHVNKKFRDVMNEDDEDWAPHFSQRLLEYDGYYEKFTNKNYIKEYNWLSKYFTVSVSPDGEYFSEWNDLDAHKNLKAINFKNECGDLKEVNEKDFYFYINREYTEPMDEGGKISYNIDNRGGILATGEATISNAVVNNGNNTSKEKSDEGENNTEVENYVGKHIKIWKTRAFIYFIIYILIYIAGVVLYYKKSLIFNFDFKSFKETNLFEVIKYAYPLLGVALVYKLLYERIFDPAKEIAKRNLLKEKAKKMWSKN